MIPTRKRKLEGPKPGARGGFATAPTASPAGARSQPRRDGLAPALRNEDEQG